MGPLATRPRLLLLGFVLAASCTGPAGHPVRLDSEPPGAHFRTSWGERGTTPSMLRVPRGQRCRIRLELEGCEPREVELVQRNDFATLTRVTFGLLMDVAPSDEAVPIPPGRVQVEAGSVCVKLEASAIESSSAARRPFHPDRPVASR